MAALNMRQTSAPLTGPQCTPTPTRRRVNWSAYCLFAAKVAIIPPDYAEIIVLVIRDGVKGKLGIWRAHLLMLCPYCLVRPPDSDDHVFPRFLGGKATIPACKECNNKRFGRTFEAAASRHFLAWMFFLRRCGMKPPKNVRWKRIYQDKEGHFYDVDQDFKATRSKPETIRDDSGRITRAVGSERDIGQIVIGGEEGPTNASHR
jgi:5-methylcytosine-specific restriction endonuclease McrA